MKEEYNSNDIDCPINGFLLLTSVIIIPTIIKAIATDLGAGKSSLNSTNIFPIFIWIMLGIVFLTFFGVFKFKIYDINNLIGKKISYLYLCLFFSGMTILLVISAPLMIICVLPFLLAIAVNDDIKIVEEMKRAGIEMDMDGPTDKEIDDFKRNHPELDYNDVYCETAPIIDLPIPIKKFFNFTGKG